jgi:hypothetical protein
MSALLVFACASHPDQHGDGIDDDLPIGKGDGAVSEGSPEACAALGAANRASRDELDGDAGLTSTAADSIIEHRPFADLAALDDAPWIGPIALDRLVAYGESPGLTCAPSPLADLRLRGSLVLFSGDNQDEYAVSGVAAYTVTLRRGSFMRFHAIGPGTSSNAVVDIFGPIASALAEAPHRMGPGAPDSPVELLAPADGVYLVTIRDDDDDARGFFSIRLDFATEIDGGDDLEPLDPAIACDDDDDCPAASTCGPNRAMVSIAAPPRVCNPSVPGRWQHGQCDEPGGTYRTVTVTADEACAMVDLLNHAPYSALRPLGSLRDWTYGTSRDVGWHVLAQWSRTKFEHSAVTSYAVAGARAAATTWQDSGEVVEDTVASTYAERANLSGRGVLIPAAFATQDAGLGPDGEACVEIRDAVGAASYLLACACNDDPTCDEGAISATADLVGHQVVVGGTLRFIDGRWRIDARTLRRRD